MTEQNLIAQAILATEKELFAEAFGREHASTRARFHHGLCGRPSNNPAGRTATAVQDAVSIYYFVVARRAIHERIRQNRDVGDLWEPWTRLAEELESKHRSMPGEKMKRRWHRRLKLAEKMLRGEIPIYGPWTVCSCGVGYREIVNLPPAARQDGFVERYLLLISRGRPEDKTILDLVTDGIEYELSRQPH